MKRLVGILAVFVLVALVGVPSDGLAARGVAKKMCGQFVSAYEPCTVPNDTTDDGQPACSPAISGDPVCGYDGDRGSGKIKAQVGYDVVRSRFRWGFGSWNIRRGSFTTFWMGWWWPSF